MFEETNQTETIAENDIFLEDADLEPTSEGEAQQEAPLVESEASTGSPEQTSEGETVKAKYNGREIPIDAKAAQATARALGVSVPDYLATLQKGMNYDRIMQQAQALRQENAILDEMARENGMSRQQFLEQLKQQRIQAAAMREMQALNEKYNNEVPLELLQEIAQTRAQFKQQEAGMRLQQQAALEKEQRQKPWLEFFKQYPNMNAEKLPQKIFEEVAGGMTPVQAYLKYELEQKEKELSILKKKEENKKNTPGTAKSEGAGEEKDAFLAGLFGG